MEELPQPHELVEEGQPEESTAKPAVPEVLEPEADFGLGDLGSWGLGLAIVPVSDADCEKGNQEKQNQDDDEGMDKDQKQPKDMDIGELESEAAKNLEAVQQEFYDIDSFTCFHDMFFAENQPWFTDATLRQFAKQKANLAEASQTVWKNISAVLPVQDQEWRPNVTPETSMKDALLAAAQGFASKIQVKGEPFVLMVDELHKDSMRWHSFASLEYEL